MNLLFVLTVAGGLIYVITRLRRLEERVVRSNAAAGGDTHEAYVDVTDAYEIANEVCGDKLQAFAARFARPARADPPAPEPCVEVPAQSAPPSPRAAPATATDARGAAAPAGAPEAASGGAASEGEAQEPTPAES